MAMSSENHDNICPNCGLGYLKTTSKPYLRLFLKKLFTIPNARCYECDICRYCEFDEANFDMISDMMLGARVYDNDDKTRPITTFPDDSNSPQQKPPRF